MFWNDPSMYGATMTKDYGKELFPKEYGFTPFMHQPYYPWMMNQRFPFFGQNYGFTPYTTPNLQQPYLYNYGFKPFGYGYEFPFHAYRNLPW